LTLERASLRLCNIRVATEIAEDTEIAGDIEKDAKRTCRTCPESNSSGCGPGIVALSVSPASPRRSSIFSVPSVAKPDVVVLA
jgi:hypothetical protein